MCIRDSSVWALEEEGYETIIVNNNPETVSTDFDIANKLYFEPLTPEDVENIVRLEKPDGAVVQFGGQTAIKLTEALLKMGVKILGTSAENVDAAEDREDVYKRQIQKRMKSIQDTMKITNAMYMISSSKLRNAKQRLEDTEPYFYSLQMAFNRFLRHVPDTESVFFGYGREQAEEKKRKGYLVITADKGLAGAYNHNVIKKAHELFEQSEHNRLFVVGELGRQYFAREGLDVDTNFQYTVQNPSLHRARVIRCV